MRNKRDRGLIALTKIKGAGAGVTQYLTPIAYQRAKARGILKDFMLTSEIEEIEVVEIEETTPDLEINEEEIVVEDVYYTSEDLEQQTIAELKETIKGMNQGFIIPSGQVKKQILIDLILNNQ